MLTYTFKCEKCKEEFDIVCEMKDRKEPRKCPKCKSDKTIRVFTRIALKRSIDLCPPKM